MATLFKIFVKAAAMLMLFAATSVAQIPDKSTAQDSSDIRVLEERLKQQNKNNETKLEAIRNEIGYRDNARKSEIELRTKELEKRIDLYFWGGSLVLVFIAFLLRFLGAKTMVNWIKDKINEKVNEITEKELEKTWADIFQKFAEQKTEEYESSLTERLNKLEKEREEYSRLKDELLQMKDSLAMKEPSPEERSEKYEKFEEKLLSIKREEQYTSIDWELKGTSEYLKGNYKEANEYYGKAIEKDPKNAIAYYNRGLTYSQLKKYEKALADYDIAIELDPNKSEPYNNRGLTYLRLKKYEKALADYDIAIELDPGNIIAYENMAELLIFRGEHDLAIGRIEKAMIQPKESKEKAVLLYLKCIAQKLSSKDTMEAEAELEEILKEDIALTWSYDDIEEWIIAADIPEENRKFIEEKTEKLKKKLK